MDVRVLRAEREMQEDLTCRVEEPEYGGQRERTRETTIKRQGRRGECRGRMQQGCPGAWDGGRGLGVAREKLTVEERKRDSPERERMWSGAGQKQTGSTG
jgi:hypothetical protein